MRNYPHQIGLLACLWGDWSWLLIDIAQCGRHHFLATESWIVYILRNSAKQKQVRVYFLFFYGCGCTAWVLAMASLQRWTITWNYKEGKQNKKPCLLLCWFLSGSLLQQQKWNKPSTSSSTRFGHFKRPHSSPMLIGVLFFTTAKVRFWRIRNQPHPGQTDRKGEGPRWTIKMANWLFLHHPILSQKPSGLFS